MIDIYRTAQGLGRGFILNKKIISEKSEKRLNNQILEREKRNKNIAIVIKSYTKKKMNHTKHMTQQNSGNAKA